MAWWRGLCRLPKYGYSGFNKISQRLLSSSGVFPIEEIQVPMPWGHVCVKRWGNPDGIPILALHGLQDNAASFDTLAPMLPLKDYCFFALEMPGHGCSSRYPDGMTYHATDGLIVIKRFQQHMGFKATHILGHSMGAGIAAWYSSMYPKNVDKLIMMDLIGFLSSDVTFHSPATSLCLKANIKIIDKYSQKSTPAYTFQEAVSRALRANELDHGQGSITRKSVETLMTRGLREVGTNEQGEKLYTWTADFRLRIPHPFQVVFEQAQHFAEQIKCPHLLIKASNSYWYTDDRYAGGIIKTYYQTNPNFKAVIVEGGHHVHLNEPEKVAPYINEFLNTKFDVKS